jgi:hypothetical protein
MMRWGTGKSTEVQYESTGSGLTRLVPTTLPMP